MKNLRLLEIYILNTINLIGSVDSNKSQKEGYGSAFSLTHKLMNQQEGYISW